MEWPSQYPDLNPIENLWAILNAKASNRRPQNDEELFEALEFEWNRFDVSILENLIDSMNRRCHMVIDSDGYPTKY